MQRRSFLHAAAMLGLSPGLLHAESYPSSPIKLLVGFAAGGITDLSARALAEPLSHELKQPIIVDNRSGAGGNIASAELARAPADGYTLMLASPGQLVVNPLTQKSLGFDRNTAFSLIGLTNTSPFVLLVPTNSRFRTLAEFLDYGKKNPGKLSFGSPGIGTTMHIGGEMLNAVAGLQAVHVPYRGGSQSTTDLVAGRVDFMIDSVGAVSGQLESGQLRVLAVATPQRMSRFPDLPALAEVFPDVELSSWLGVVGPPNLPPAIVATLAGALQRAVSVPAYKEFVMARGSAPADPRPEFFAAHLEREKKRVEKTVVARHLLE